MVPHITTFTHRKVNPLDVQASDICIEDIAHHLSCINRFNGALQIPVNVAQHSVYVSKLSGPGHQLEGLLHDAAEAYVGDVTKWLKQSDAMAEFRAAELRAHIAVCQCFGIPMYGEGLHASVEAADKLMVRFEAMRSGIRIPHPDYGYPQMGEIQRIGAWVPWNWRNSERAFLKRFRELNVALHSGNLKA